MNAIETSRRTSGVPELANILFGIWLILSPFVLGFNKNIADMCSNIAVGIALIVVALVGIWADEALEGLIVPLGAWLFISAFVLGFAPAPFLVNNALLAFVVIATGAISDGLRLPAARTQ